MVCDNGWEPGGVSGLVQQLCQSPLETRDVATGLRSVVEGNPIKKNDQNCLPGCKTREDCLPLKGFALLKKKGLADLIQVLNTNLF